MNNLAHEIVREHLTWGTLGKNQEHATHKSVVLKDMSNYHIGNILADQYQITADRREIMEHELRYRVMNNIFIKDTYETSS